MDRARLRCICIGHRTRNYSLFTDPNSYRESNSERTAESQSDTNSNGYGNSDSYCDGDVHTHCDANGTASIAYTDNYTPSIPHTNSNCYSYSNTDCKP